MSAARTRTIPLGSTTIPSAGPPWRPRVCRATSVWPVWATRSAAFVDVQGAARGLTLHPALRYSVAQGCACSRVPHCGQCPVAGSRRQAVTGAPAFPVAVPWGRGLGCCPPAVRAPRARCPRGPPEQSAGLSPCARPPGEGPAAASGSKRPDDLVCRVQRPRFGARLVWGCWLRHCFVAVPESRGWDAGCGCCLCCEIGGVRVEPHIGSATYSSGGCCQASLPGLRWVSCTCAWRPKGKWCARGGLVPRRLRGGIWRQALFLPRLPACGAASPTSHCCEGRPVFGAPSPWPSVPGVGSQRPCVLDVGGMSVGAEQQPHRFCTLRGRWEGVPGGMRGAVVRGAWG